MQDEVLQLLGRLGCYEYLLILSPHEELHQQINVIKKKFASDMQAPLAHNKAHITLVKFIASRMNEEKIINSLGHASLGIVPFKVELKDFGAFPTHTIYINVTTKVPVQNLVKEIKGAQKFMKAHKDFKPHFIDEPHITISRKLKQWKFEKGWLEYSNTNFSGRFIADSMLLLKRSLNGGPYQPAMRFEFKGMAVNVKQASLFM